MDRLNHTRMMAGLGLSLALALGATGCRSTRSEVPAKSPFTGAGPAPGGVGFGSSPNPVTGMSAMPGGGGEGLPGSPANGSQFGTPAPGAANYGMPTANTYGPPGTSTLATPPPSSLGGGLPPSAMSAPPSASDPTTGIPQTGTGPAGAAAAPGLGAESAMPSNPAPGQLPAPTPGPFQ